MVDQVISYLREKGITINNLGEPSKLVGLQVNCDASRNIHITQSVYALAKVKEFNLTEANGRATPAFGAITETDQETTHFPYREIIGSLQYLASGTRPDISCPVSKLARFNNKPTREHWVAAKNVLRYVKGTSNYGITYRGDQTHQTPISIECYVDSDFASSPDAKSTTGYVIKIANGPVIWGSHKQSMVTLSSTEAELVALTAASRELCWLINILQEMQLKPQLPIVVHEDNQACISNVYSEGVSNRTKHINIRHFFIQQQVKQGIQRVDYVPSTANIADILTKTPHRDLFEKLRASMGIEPPPISTSGSVEQSSSSPSQSEPKVTVSPKLSHQHQTETV
jgi:hypothetical protein